ncbi:MAG TPA: VOC family protein [Chryseosolibacter sp.]|nr:VOC family protein [Chryseosolibacter sp.]
MENPKSRKAVRAVPEGFRTVTPYLVADNAMDLIAFMQQAFGAQLTFMMKDDAGKVMHASVSIGDSPIMISDLMDDMQRHTAMLYLYLDDVDAVYKKAISAKAIPVREPTDEFYGDRAAAVKDVWGNVWWMDTQVEDVDEEELERRSREAMRDRKETRNQVKV